MELVENQVDALIMAAFPQYKYEEIEKWTWNKTAKMAAMAEWVLNIKGLDIRLHMDLDDSPEVPPPQIPMPKEL